MKTMMQPGKLCYLSYTVSKHWLSKKHRMQYLGGWGKAAGAGGGHSKYSFLMQV